MLRSARLLLSSSRPSFRYRRESEPYRQHRNPTRRDAGDKNGHHLESCSEGKSSGISAL